MKVSYQAGSIPVIASWPHWHLNNRPGPIYNNHRLIRSGGRRLDDFTAIPDDDVLTDGTRSVSHFLYFLHHREAEPHIRQFSEDNMFTWEIIQILNKVWQTLILWRASANKWAYNPMWWQMAMFNVRTVQMWCWHRCDEKLRSIGVRASVGHG